MLSSNKKYYFNDLNGVGRNYPVEDDHIPFLKRSKTKIFLYISLNALI